MNKEQTLTIVDNFINALNNVRETQTWLLLTASHLRTSISRNEADTRLIVMAEYLEKQGSALQAFIRGLDEVPTIDLVIPEEVVSRPVDPKLN